MNKITEHIAFMLDSMGDNPRRAVYMVVKELYRSTTNPHHCNTEMQFPQENGVNCRKLQQNTQKESSLHDKTNSGGQHNG